MKALYRIMICLVTVLSLGGCYLLEEDLSNLSMSQIEGTLWEMDVTDSNMFDQVKSGKLYVKFFDRKMWVFNDSGFQAFYNVYAINYGTFILEYNNKTEGVNAKLSDDEKTLTFFLPGKNPTVLKSMKYDYPIDVMGYWLVSHQTYMGQNVITLDDVEGFMPDGRNISFTRQMPGALHKDSEVRYSFNEKSGCYVTESVNGFKFDMKIKGDTLRLVEQTGTGTSVLVPWKPRTFTAETCNLLNWWVWENEEEGLYYMFDVPHCTQDSLPAKYTTIDKEGNTKSHSFYTMGRTQLVTLEKEGHQAFTTSYSNGVITMSGNTCTKTLKTVDVMHSFYRLYPILENGALRIYIPNGTYVDMKGKTVMGSGTWHIDWDTHSIITD